MPYRSPSNHHDGDPPRRPHKFQHDVARNLEERVREEEHLSTGDQLLFGKISARLETYHQGDVVLLVGQAEINTHAYSELSADDAEPGMPSSSYQRPWRFRYWIDRDRT